MLCDHADQVAEDGFASPFRQLMLLGQSRSKMFDRYRTAGLGWGGWFFASSDNVMVIPSEERGTALLKERIIRCRKESGLTSIWQKLGDARKVPVRRQRSLDRTGGLKKGEFLAHRNVHRSEDETANSIIEGTG